MLNYKDGQLLKDENSVCSVAALSVLGDRNEQQDSMGFLLKQNEGLVAICDGMGGHLGGSQASQTAIGCVLSAYSESAEDIGYDRLLRDAAKKADLEVASLKSPLGEPLKAGSTMVSVIIKNRQLVWCSVGDSRAYLLRNGEFVQLTQDHNYMTVLLEKYRQGIITDDEFLRERSKGEALISFLGLGNLELIDYSAHPLELMQDDKIILMSDGLYKILTDEEIQRITDNFSNIGEAVAALEMKAKKNAKNKNQARDNITVALIKVL